jgi:RNA polymerase sigma factor (sigma-70 family)
MNLARLMPSLRAFLSRRAPARDVDDMLQDVLMRVHNRRGEAIDNLEGYVFQVAQSTLVDHARRNQVRRREQHVELIDSHHPTDEFTPERVLSGKEQVARLTQALNELPPRTRDAIVLVRFEGMSYKQVANQFGVSVSAVEKHVMKAMAHLTSRMQEQV